MPSRPLKGRAKHDPPAPSSPGATPAGPAFRVGTPTPAFTRGGVAQGRVEPEEPDVRLVDDLPEPEPEPPRSLLGGDPDEDFR